MDTTRLQTNDSYENITTFSQTGLLLLFMFVFAISALQCAEYHHSSPFPHHQYMK